MSEALCQCGHTEDLHRRWQDDPVNCYGLIGGHGDLPCGCRQFTPPPTREPIRLTDEEREPACPACGHALDSPDGCSECPAPTLTDEAEAAWLKWVYENADLFNTDRLSFLAGFRAARLAGGPTLADAWDEGRNAGVTDMTRVIGWGAGGCKEDQEPNETPNPYRTPESEDTE